MYVIFGVSLYCVVVNLLDMSVVFVVFDVVV